MTEKLDPLRFLEKKFSLNECQTKKKNVLLCLKLFSKYKIRIS